MSDKGSSRLIFEIVLGLGSVPASARNIDRQVRTGIARVEFANGFYIFAPILALWLAVSDLYGRVMPIYVWLLIGLVFYYLNMRTLKRVAKETIKYHYRYRGDEPNLKKLRIKGWAYFIGAAVFCWLLIVLTALGLFLLN